LGSSSNVREKRVGNVTRGNRQGKRESHSLGRKGIMGKILNLKLDLKKALGEKCHSSRGKKKEGSHLILEMKNKKRVIKKTIFAAPFNAERSWRHRINAR